MKSFDKNSINLLEERDYYKAMNIDEFVLDKADWLNNIMTEYMEIYRNVYRHAPFPNRCMGSNRWVVRCSPDYGHRLGIGVGWGHITGTAGV